MKIKWDEGEEVVGNNLTFTKTDNEQRKKNPNNSEINWCTVRHTAARMQQKSQTKMVVVTVVICIADAQPYDDHKPDGDRNTVRRLYYTQWHACSSVDIHSINLCLNILEDNDCRMSLGIEFQNEMPFTKKDELRAWQLLGHGVRFLVRL